MDSVVRGRIDKTERKLFSAGVKIEEVMGSNKNGGADYIAIGCWRGGNENKWKMEIDGLVWFGIVDTIHTTT